MEIYNYINPTVLLDGYIGFGGFNLIHKFLEEGWRTNMNRNMANNFTALIHASGSVAISGLYILTKKSNIYRVLRSYSTGYFLYDLVQSIKYQPFPSNFIYSYHHLATILYIHQNPKIYKGDEIIFWGELSNIPSYFVYYLLKTNKNSKYLPILKKLQFIIYTFIRLPITSYYFYNLLKMKEDKSRIYMLMPICFMGLHWIKKFWNKL